ncbi:metallophosphoesterase [Planococcus maitriensis]|uniref:Phosphoesterase n=1 Tax=Planococcus maitriensis TaxID=221799 RepID=A0A365KD47_9BACL|nr:metallophosphoesterase [Planococcus maitriensis]RAZ70161.1 phosphoesterase [Planococcus maitriensis]
MKWILRSALAGLALLAWMFRSAHTEIERTAAVRLSGDAEFSPFKLLFISDVHRRKLRQDMFSDKVDLVVIGGDFVERGVPEQRIRENLKVLSGLAPVYYVFGNNDREIGEERLRMLLEEQGAIILDDESIELFGNTELKLTGIDYFAFRENSIEAAFRTVDKDDSVIFISHTPFVFKHVKQHYPASLLLAGHTHGGQIRLGRFGIFERGSLVVSEGITELVSNGFGTTTLPLRLGAKAEFHVLEIHPASAGEDLAQSSSIG